MKIYTYLALLVLASAQHDHYKHLDLDYVFEEATRLAYTDKESIVKLIADSSATIRQIIHKRDDIITKAESVEQAKTAWKEEFENNYADDFDNALIASDVCKVKYGDIPECRAYIDWNHHFDTRDEDLRNEFLEEVHTVIRRAFWEVKGHLDL